MAAVRVPLSAPAADDVDAGACLANEQMAACNTRSSSSSSPSPPARPCWLFSTSYVSPAQLTSQRADLHLHLPRTLRHDSAAVQPMAARAYHATRLDSSDQAAVLVSGTVGWRPETSWFGLQLRHYSPRHLRSGRSQGPPPVFAGLANTFPTKPAPFLAYLSTFPRTFKVGFGVFRGVEHDGRDFIFSKTSKGKLFSVESQVCVNSR